MQLFDSYPYLRLSLRNLIPVCSDCNHPRKKFSINDFSSYAYPYANSPQLATRCGQKPVVHLRFNLRKVYEWATANHLRTFVTNANAAAAQAEIFDDIRALALLDWDSIEARDWRDGAVKSMKESEFLVENRVPLALLEEIGVIDESHQKVVNDIVSGHPELRHVSVNIQKDWYY